MFAIIFFNVILFTVIFAGVAAIVDNGVRGMRGLPPRGLLRP